jgi:hypothetical protein
MGGLDVGELMEIRVPVVFAAFEPAKVELISDAREFLGRVHSYLLKNGRKKCPQGARWVGTGCD